MPRHFDRELGHLKGELLGMAGTVETMMGLCRKALQGRRSGGLEEVFEHEKSLNRLQRELTEKVVQLIARHQPVADDLRLLVSALNMLSNLERMGDLCVNLARKALDLGRHGPSELMGRLSAMLEDVLSMIHRANEAFVRGDTSLAEGVLRADDGVDSARDELTRLVIQRVPGDRDLACELVEALLASRNIERIADQATNVAEDIIYLVEGRDVRHQISESHEQPGSWEEIRRIPEDGSGTAGA